MAAEVADPTWLVSLKLAGVVFLVLLNGFFVAAEFAIVKIRASRIETLVAKGDRRAGLAKRAIDHLDAYLSATQLGITLSSIGLGWIGEPAVASLITPALAAAGITNPAVIATVSFAVAFSFITFLHIVFGELAPKSLAIQRSEATTLAIARPLHVFYVLFKPFIVVLNGAANMMLRAVGIKPASEHDLAHGEEELRLILAASGRARRLDKQRAETLLNVFELKDLLVRAIMTPRTRVIALDVRRSMEENVRVADASGFTRFPLVEGTLDNVIGFVHYRDIVRLAREGGAGDRLRAIKREVLFTPESRPVEALLREMLKAGRNMSVVVDEHGSVAGIVTLEDIFEEVFGDIRGEFEIQGAEAVTRVAEGHYLVDGGLPLHEASETLGTPIRSTKVSTVAGYLAERLGRIPKIGDKVRVGPYDAVVKEMQRHRVRQVEFKRRKSTAGGKST